LPISIPGRFTSGNVAVPAGHKGATFHLGRGHTGNGPVGGRRRCSLVADGLHQLLAARQVAKGKRAPGAALNHFAVLNNEGGPLDAFTLGGQIQQNLARGGGGLAQLRHHRWRGPAAERAHVERDQVRVAHHQTNRRDRHAQLVGDHLRQRGAAVLADLDLAGVCRDRSVRADVQPRPDLLGQRHARPAPPPAALLLRSARHLVQREQYHNARAEQPEELAPGHLPTLSRFLVQFVPLRLQRQFVNGFVFHGAAFLVARAARRTAATIRWYVPQRQRFLSRA
jgi:hypothetical protein